jgi:peptide deformylase
MALLEIITAPDPRLKRKARAVGHVDDTVRRLMDDMLETMYAAPGIGLAAPQVGVERRVIVVDVGPKDGPRQPLALADPEIVWVSDDDAVAEEGCLSVPEHYAEVDRPAAVRVRYRDRDNKLREIAADGLLSVCLQHEIDHLDGVLFIDRISALKRNMILRKLVKARRQTAA